MSDLDTLDWRDRLKEALDVRRLTYSGVSERAGFNKDYISKMLNGKINPTVEKLLKICDEIGIEPTELFSSEPTDDVQEVIDETSHLSDEEAKLVSKLLKRFVVLGLDGKNG